VALGLLCSGCASRTNDATPTEADLPRAEPAASDSPAPAGALAPDDAVGPLQMRGSGLGYAEITPGTGPVAQPGDLVTVHFVGQLDDGKVFDSTYRRGTPFEFELGDDHVLQGFNEGVEGMRVGGKRRLIVPAPLGYGAQGAPPDIPPNALLEFDVELLAVERP